MHAVGDGGGGQHGREVQKVRGNNTLAHGFEQIGNAAAPDKGIRGRLEGECAREHRGSTAKAGAWIPCTETRDNRQRDQAEKCR